MIIHVRTAHRRCQAQIVAQDTEQKHGKHFFWNSFFGEGELFFGGELFFWNSFFLELFFLELFFLELFFFGTLFCWNSFLLELFFCWNSFFFLELAGRTCLMFVVIPRGTMSTEQWSIHGDLQRRSVTRKCCSSQVSCLTRCMRKLRRSTRWLWYGLLDRARCVSRDVTLHRLSVLNRLVDNSPLDSHLHLNASHAKECLTHHPCIESVTVGCL